MLYIKGTVNSVSRKEPEGKKPFYSVSFRNENDNGTVFTTWCKIYTDKTIELNKELEVQVKVNAWAKDKFQLIGFIK